MIPVGAYMYLPGSRVYMWVHLCPGRFFEALPEVERKVPIGFSGITIEASVLTWKVPWDYLIHTLPSRLSEVKATCTGPRECLIAELGILGTFPVSGCRSSVRRRSISGQPSRRHS